MKDPKKQKAGRARWLSMSADERRKFTSEAGKKGGKALAEKWKKFNEQNLSTGALD